MRTRTPDGREAADQRLAVLAGPLLACADRETAYELPDVADCPARSGAVCSLCCPLDSECGDMCRKGEAAGPVLIPVPTLPLPPREG
ncbi:hypothetical protein [Streptomyces enissocaesilis]|uniref:hypothetical protein n=1 Tax=Streptomyces enissocaesilis TaxID=332589 RepID=UPI003CD09541